MSLEILYNYEKSRIKNKADAFVCSLHFCMIANGYKCTGKGEEISKENVKKSDMLPSDWSNDDDPYTLIYQQENTSDSYLLKILKFDGLLLVHLLRVKDEKMSSMEVNPSDFVNENISSFDSAFRSIDELKKKCKKELLDEFNEKKKSIQNKTALNENETSARPLQRDPHMGWTPEWENERGHPLRTGGPSIGRSDLDPFGGFDGRGGGIGGNGMYFDPMRTGFPPPCGGGYGSSGIGGPHLPRGSVPPGARFDPFVPPIPDPNGSIHPNFRNQRSDPDPDHLPPPPGCDDMFM